MDFEKILNSVKPSTMKKVAVAAAEDDVVLKAVYGAYERGIATPILCGDEKKINGLAKELNLDISKFEIINANSDIEAAKTAALLVRNKKADILMKGLLQTADLLRAVLDKENGLRGKGILSHVSIIHSPILEKTLFLTDAAMVTYPDLKTKVQLINNAVVVARGMGIENPKVAPLAPVEVVNTDMQSSVDGALLTAMNRRGQIKDCIVDGPLAMDLALSEEAVKHKGVKSEVAGKADILLFHNIDAANNSLKAFTIGGGSLFGGVVMGATAPIVLTSRSDSDQSKLYSIACAARICK